MASRTTDLNNALAAAGFTVRRHRKHMIWDCPCGHAQITTSSTRQGGSGDTWIYSLMKRTKLACDENMKAAKAA